MSIRVRFAPSPTGALHIGGVRTALYNYLLAHKHNGTFIIRIEDTDQARFVPGAEEYIIKSLAWLGIMPTEGPGIGGNYGPYRQSERKDIYEKYTKLLLESGNVYYAFDTPEELAAIRQEHEQGGKSFKYDAQTRMLLRNSLSMPNTETQELLSKGIPWVLRMKIPQNEEIIVHDIIRGDVNIHSSELDDKVLMKSDGMPTYHLANIIDDHLMEITHVIRGEEWLPSAAHHVLLYRFFGWKSPLFAHLPLILKPDGNGKLSKRDGAKFGFPVFPMDWQGEKNEDSFLGFDGFGFDPHAVINFLALLGWNPGNDQEIFSLDELIEAFSLEKINKSGARFNFDKAKWFNQQYIAHTDNDILAQQLSPLLAEKGYRNDLDFVSKFCGLMKERVIFLTDFIKNGYYFFEDVKEYDIINVQKRWKKENISIFESLNEMILQTAPFEASNIEANIKNFMQENGLKPGDILPILRIALAGTMQGPAVFDMAALLGKEQTISKLNKGYQYFNTL